MGKHRSFYGPGARNIVRRVLEGPEFNSVAGWHILAASVSQPILKEIVGRDQRWLDVLSALTSHELNDSMIGCAIGAGGHKGRLGFWDAWVLAIEIIVRFWLAVWLRGRRARCCWVAG